VEAHHGLHVGVETLGVLGQPVGHGVRLLELARAPAHLLAHVLAARGHVGLPVLALGVQVGIGLRLYPRAAEHPAERSAGHALGHEHVPSLRALGQLLHERGPGRPRVGLAHTGPSTSPGRAGEAQHPAPARFEL
jgi:hypothetical protein